MSKKLHGIAKTPSNIALTSSSATKPFLSSLTSSRSGCNDPFFSLPNPSPGFHPIFCSKCMPIPPDTGVVDINWSYFIIKYDKRKKNQQQKIAREKWRWVHLVPAKVFIVVYHLQNYDQFYSKRFVKSTNE